MIEATDITKLNWLVTGGCGFVGRMVIHTLLERGVPAGRIRVIDNFSVGDVKDLEIVVPVLVGLREFDEIQNGCSLFEGDIRNREDAARAANGADVIVHLAACTGIVPAMKDPLFDCESNVIGTLNMLEGARFGGCKRFIFASSGAPLGAVEPPIHEGLPGKPSSPYGASKLAGEAYCSAYFHAFGVEGVALRFGNLYGPLSGHKTSIVANFINRALKGEAMQIYGNGSITRDYIYGPDLVEAICLAVMTPNIGGEVFQIASAAETSVSEIADIVKEALHSEGVERVEIEKTEPRVGDIQRNYADTSKARTILNWTPRTPLEEGIRLTVRWFRDQA